MNQMDIDHSNMRETLLIYPGDIQEVYGFRRLLQSLCIIHKDNTRGRGNAKRSNFIFYNIKSYRTGPH